MGRIRRDSTSTSTSTMSIVLAACLEKVSISYIIVRDCQPSGGVLKRRFNRIKTLLREGEKRCVTTLITAVKETASRMTRSKASTTLRRGHLKRGGGGGGQGYFRDAVIRCSCAL